MRNPITRLDTPISQQFGVNPASYARFGLPGHEGLDLACGAGTQLYSPIDGWIVETGSDPFGYGLYCKISEDQEQQGETFLLAHCSSLGSTTAGDQVVAGTPIALSGSTGNSTGPHVHIGWRPAGLYRHTPYKGWCDPEPRLSRLNQ